MIMQRDHFNQQQKFIHTFQRLTVVNARGNIGKEKYAVTGINCTYAVDKYSQA